MYLDINRKAHMANDLNFIEEVKDFSRSSAVSCIASGNASKMYIDRDVVTRCCNKRSLTGI